MKNPKRFDTSVITFEDRKALENMIEQLHSNYPDVEWIDFYREMKDIVEMELLKLIIQDKIKLDK